MRKEIHVTTWLDRKRPSLSVCNEGGNEHRILATFTSQEAADVFIALVKKGIVALPQEPKP